MNPKTGTAGLVRRTCFGVHSTDKIIKKLLVEELFYLELGCKDSNLGMSGPKPDALPLGDTPTIA
jgi:hypothetical protein